MANHGWPTAIAIGLVGMLVLSKCDGPVDTAIGAATVAGAGGAGVGVGIGAGAAGAGAAGAVKRGVSKRVEDTISGRSPRQPRTPTTQPTPSPSIPPTTTTTRPQPTPTTKPKTDMAPDWCISIEAGTCVTVKGRG